MTTINIQRLKSIIDAGGYISVDDSKQLINDLERVTKEKIIIQNKYERLKEFFDHSDAEYLGSIRLLGDIGELMRVKGKKI